MVVVVVVLGNNVIHIKKRTKDVAADHLLTPARACQSRQSYEQRPCSRRKKGLSNGFQRRHESDDP